MKKVPSGDIAKFKLEVYSQGVDRWGAALSAWDLVVVAMRQSRAFVEAARNAVEAGR